MKKTQQRQVLKWKQHIYCSFALFEAILAMVNPVGIVVYGLPLKRTNNLRLKYNSNALSCSYITLVGGILRIILIFFS